MTGIFIPLAGFLLGLTLITAIMRFSFWLERRQDEKLMASLQAEVADSSARLDRIMARFDAAIEREKRRQKSITWGIDDDGEIAYFGDPLEVEA